MMDGRCRVAGNTSTSIALPLKMRKWTDSNYHNVRMYVRIKKKITPTSIICIITSTHFVVS